MVSYRFFPTQPIHWRIQTHPNASERIQTHVCRFVVSSSFSGHRKPCKKLVICHMCIIICVRLRLVQPSIASLGVRAANVGQWHRLSGHQSLGKTWWKYCDFGRGGLCQWGCVWQIKQEKQIAHYVRADVRDNKAANLTETKIWACRTADFEPMISTNSAEVSLILLDRQSLPHPCSSLDMSRASIG